MPNSLSLRDIYRVLFRHKRKAAFVFVSILSLVAVVIVLYPRTYQSEARLFVRPGSRESVTLDPTATTGQTMNVYDTREGEIRSLLDVLESRALVEKVVDQLGPEKVLSGKDDVESPQWLTSAIHGITATIKSVGLSEPLTAREQAVQKLLKSIRIDATKKSSVISVSCKAPTPQLAHEIVSAFVECYHSEHLRIYRTSGSHEFFARQADLLHDQLHLASETLRDEKNRIGLVSLADQQTHLESRLHKLESDMLDAESTLATSRARINVLESTLGELPERMITQEVEGHANAAADSMRNELYELQIELQGMLARYTDSHPRVRALQEQVRKSEEILERQSQDRTQIVREVDPARRQLRLELLTERTQSASHQARVKSLHGQYAQIQQKLQSLNENAVLIAQMTRKVDLLETNYRKYANNLEQARIDEALETAAISSVNTVQPATLVAKPVSPRKFLLAAVGLVLACFGSIGTALAAEQLDNSLKTTDEVEQALNLPVLLSIPRMPARQTLLN